MLTQREILSTLEMLRNEHLDVRTVTLGINLIVKQGARLVGTNTPYVLIGTGRWGSSEPWLPSSTNSSS